MRIHPTKNWIAKVLSLLLATAIWFLIKRNLDGSASPPAKPPRAIPVKERH